MPTPLFHLLARGYFPKELPPPFNTRSFGAFADTPEASILALNLTKRGVNKNFTSRGVVHNQARSGTLRRKLTIPNPVNQYQIARAVVESWWNLKRACGVSSISLTTPKYKRHGLRAISPENPFASISVARAKSRTASRYYLSTDLSQFYPSVYTHSIPWALHTKSVAKARPHDYALLGNVLDLAIRNGQDKQTIGIPIGPDTSLVIAEVLLSSVDAKLSGPVAKRGYRYIDDMGCGFRTIAEAEDALGAIQRHVGDLQLELNPRKTKISELPLELEAFWVPHLRLFTFRDSTERAQETDLLSFFGRAFELAASHRQEAILRYAVQRLRSVIICRTNWTLYENLLLQCLSVESGTAPAVIGELFKYHLRMPLNIVRITESLQQLIEDNAPLHHGSEVVWALWGAICLGCKLSANTVQKSLTASDPCVALCALHAISKGLVDGPVDVAGLKSLMSERELAEDQWLLVYEANIKGWLPNIGRADFVSLHKEFGPMKAGGVSFYDESASLDVRVFPRIIDRNQYVLDDDLDDESDDELLMQFMVSG